MTPFLLARRDPNDVDQPLKRLIPGRNGKQVMSRVRVLATKERIGELLGFVGGV